MQHLTIPLNISKFNYIKFKELYYTVLLLYGWYKKMLCGYEISLLEYETVFSKITYKFNIDSEKISILLVILVVK